MADKNDDGWLSGLRKKLKATRDKPVKKKAKKLSKKLLPTHNITPIKKKK